MSAEQGLTESAAPQDVPEEHFSGDAGGEPEFDANGVRNPHGMGQSKSSRRRRRKRKGKGGEAGAAAAEGGSESPAGEAGDSGESSGGELGSVQAAAPRAQGRTAHVQNGNVAPNGNQNGTQNGPAGQNAAGTKRWKKKFRERDRQRGGGENPVNQAAGGFANGNGLAGGQPAFRGADTHQPGNNALKRKSGGFGKQRNGGGGGSRGGFVGPMDHSYRPVNGNIFDGAAAEPSYSGARGGRNFHTSDSQPIDYSQGRVIPVREDAPTKIFFFIDDLFFTAKITETARKLGVKIAFLKNEKEQIAALTGGKEEERPGLIVFDLNNVNAKPLTLIPKLKTKLKKTTSIIGFLSHLQGDLKAKAVEAGCDTVMPRAAFSQNLPNLLRRYGIEEVDETNFNQ
jgi:CheY-like chemotaxis protein